MTILSEEGVRKIVRKKLVSEIGYRGVSPAAGQIDNIECDLSGIDQKTLAVKFAKYFIYNPKFERKVGDEKYVYTKRNLLPFLTSLNDTSDLKYEKEVYEKLSKTPGMIGKYVEMLSFAMKFAFGPFANLYCSLIVSALGSGYTRDALDADKGDFKDVDEETFTKALRKVQSAFNASISASTRISDSYHCILFPETIKELKISGGRDTPGTSRKFSLEKSFADSFIVRHRNFSSKPQKIVEDIENIIFSTVDNKQRILKPLKDTIKSIENSVPNGVILIDVLEEILTDADDSLRDIAV